MIDDDTIAEALARELTDDPFERLVNGFPPGEDPCADVPPPGDHDAPDEPEDWQPEASWQPIDLGSVLDGTADQPAPTVTVRDDGEALFYEAAVNGLHGGSGEGKGWLLCYSIAEQARRGHSSLLLDHEDVAVSIVARLLAIGVTADEIRRHLIYLRPQTPPGRRTIDHLNGIIHDRDVRLAIIDSVGEAFALEGLDENKDSDVGPWYRRVARPLADAGPAVVLADHSTKAGDNPLHPSGSKRKRAAITGASYLLEAVTPFVKGHGGRVRLTCAKDRHGNYRRGERVGDLVMVCSPTGNLTLTLYAPELATEQDATLPILLAARAAVKAAKAEGHTLPRGALEGLMTIKTRAETKRSGIDLAVARGALAESSGPRGARLITYLHDLEEHPNG